MNCGGFQFCQRNKGKFGNFVKVWGKSGNLYIALCREHFSVGRTGSFLKICFDRQGECQGILPVFVVKVRKHERMLLAETTCHHDNSLHACPFHVVTDLTSFAAIISGETYEDVYAAVKKVIRQQSSPSVWIPTRDKL